MIEILSIVPAVAGWRTVHALLGYADDPENADTDSLVYTRPVACFALVDDDTEIRRVLPVTPDDWPQYLWPDDESEDMIGYLGPGDDLHQDYVDEAKRMIIARREKLAKLRAEA